MNSIVVNYLFDEEHCQVVKSSPKRTWMDETNHKFAYRCLPMAIANQCSWDVLCPSTIRASWDGTSPPDAVKVEYYDPQAYHYAKGEFGHGVLTFHTDFVITTNNTNSVYCKGPANQHKKNIQPLEGIIETFWLPFTFTMNWKFEEPGDVIFEKDEIMFSFSPIDLNYIESFDIIKTKMKLDNNLFVKYQTFSNSRTEHLQVGHTEGESWQKYYMKGKCPFSDFRHPNHKSRLNIKDIHE
jgi:hypothetical protein